jgi:hypothetical protein
MVSPQRLGSTKISQCSASQPSLFFNCPAEEKNKELALLNDTFRIISKKLNSSRILDLEKVGIKQLQKFETVFCPNMSEKMGGRVAKEIVDELLSCCTVTRIEVIFRYPDRVPLTHFVHGAKKVFSR